MPAKMPSNDKSLELNIVISQKKLLHQFLTRKITANRKWTKYLKTDSVPWVITAPIPVAITTKGSAHATLCITKMTLLWKSENKETLEKYVPVKSDQILSLELKKEKKNYLCKTVN